MTLKYNEYECVKFNGHYHNSKLDIYHTHSVRENRNVKVFAIYEQGAISRQAGLTQVITEIHIFHVCQKLSQST